MAFVTFLGRDPDGNALSRISVTLWREDGEQVLQSAVYGPYFPGESIRVVELVPGNYVAMVLADGYVFSYPHPIVVPSEGGLTADAYLVLDVVAASTSVRSSTSLPARVTGYASAHIPSNNLSLLGIGFGSQSKGPGDFARVVPNPVIFAKVLTSDDTPTMFTGPSVAVPIDINGRFEVALEPDTLYRVRVPGLHGFPFIRTPASGESADVETLIQESATTPAYEVVKP